MPSSLKGFETFRYNRNVVRKVKVGNRIGGEAVFRRAPRASRRQRQPNQPCARLYHFLASFVNKFILAADLDRERSLVIHVVFTQRKLLPIARVRIEPDWVWTADDGSSP